MGFTVAVVLALVVSNPAPEKNVPMGLVCGQVVDDVTGDALKSASVFSADWGAVTDDSGCYSIVLPAGEHMLHCSYLGYPAESTRARVSPARPETIDFVLTGEDDLMSTWDCGHDWGNDTLTARFRGMSFDDTIQVTRLVGDVLLPEDQVHANSVRLRAWMTWVGHTSSYSALKVVKPPDGDTLVLGWLEVVDGRCTLARYWCEKRHLEWISSDNISLAWTYYDKATDSLSIVPWGDTIPPGHRLSIRIHDIACPFHQPEWW